MKGRIEPELTAEYRKNPDDEQFLEKINKLLAPFQEQDYQEISEKYPILHITGVPRSGTTLLVQLLAVHTNIGYINNLISAFWRAPVYGIRLSKKLKISLNNSNYKSNFGRTNGIAEPHEFGYFWSHLLGYREMQEGSIIDSSIDWSRFQLVLNNMAHAFEHPIVFKSFLSGWHMEKIQEALPKTCWVRIRRNRMQTALSILEMRKKMLGSEHNWASLKPKEYKWLKTEPYWRQIAGQVVFIEKRHSKQILLLPSTNVIDVTYEQLCREPLKVLNAIIGMMQDQGGDVELVSQPPSILRNRIRPVDSYSESHQLEKAIERYLSY